MADGFVCPRCGKGGTGVTDSRPALSGGAIRRRRTCPDGHRFTTYELVVDGPTVIRPGAGGRPAEALPLDEWKARIVASLTSGVPELIRRIVK